MMVSRLRVYPHRTKATLLPWSLMDPSVWKRKRFWFFFDLFRFRFRSVWAYFNSYCKTVTQLHSERAQKCCAILIGGKNTGFCWRYPYLDYFVHNGTSMRQSHSQHYGYLLIYFLLTNRDVMTSAGESVIVTAIKVRDVTNDLDRRCYGHERLLSHGLIFYLGCKKICATHQPKPGPTKKDSYIQSKFHECYNIFTWSSFEWDIIDNYPEGWVHFWFLMACQSWRPTVKYLVIWDWKQEFAFA